jgi:hypothetical protein
MQNSYRVLRKTGKAAELDNRLERAWDSRWVYAFEEGWHGDLQELAAAFIAELANSDSSFAGSSKSF